MTPEEKLRQFRARKPEGGSALDRIFNKGRAIGSAVTDVAARADAGRGNNSMILSPGKRTNPNPVKDTAKSATQTAARSARTGVSKFTPVEYPKPAYSWNLDAGARIADFVRRPFTDRKTFSTTVPPGGDLRIGVENLDRQRMGKDELPYETQAASPEQSPAALTPDPEITRTPGDAVTRYNIGENNTLDINRRIEGPMRGTVSEGIRDTYAGYDISKLSPGEASRFRIEADNRAADAFAENRRRFAPRPQGGSNLVMRNRLLGEYKEKMNQVLEDSRTRKLTARGTANAIDALNGYYSQALGLSPQQEEAGRNYRAELATQETPDSTTPQKRYSVETDDYGNTAVFDAVTGKLDYTKSAQYRELYAEYQQALGDPTKTERARSLLLQLQSLGYDPEAE